MQRFIFCPKKRLIMQLRVMTIQDYEKIKALWKSIDGFYIRSIDDSLEGMQKFLAKNPHTNVVALQNDEIGVLQQGKKADIILLDLQSVNMFPAKNIVGSIVHSANTSNVDLTMIDGKILYQNGQYTFDTKDIISCAIKSANKFLRRIYGQV